MLARLRIGARLAVVATTDYAVEVEAGGNVRRVRAAVDIPGC